MTVRAVRQGCPPATPTSFRRDDARPTARCLAEVSWATSRICPEIGQNPPFSPALAFAGRLRPAIVLLYRPLSNGLVGGIHVHSYQDARGRRFRCALGLPARSAGCGPAISPAR